MKLKLFFVAFAFGLTTLSTSCVKQRNCQCTTISSNGTSSVQNYNLASVAGINGGKKNAESSCKSYEQTDSYSSTTCELTK
jgi:hypothetical protein